MRQGANKRSRGRGGRNKPHIPLRMQTFDSNGPDVRIRGNAWQVHERYMNMARDAFQAGDRIAAENFYQHADHYYRIITLSEENRGQQGGAGPHQGQGGQPDGGQPGAGPNGGPNGGPHGGPHGGMDARSGDQGDGYGEFNGDGREFEGGGHEPRRHGQEGGERRQGQEGGERRQGPEGGERRPGQEGGERRPGQEGGERRPNMNGRGPNGGEHHPRENQGREPQGRENQGRENQGRENQGRRGGPAPQGDRQQPDIEPGDEPRRLPAAD